jgi:phenylalanine-4-hydroxylase
MPRMSGAFALYELFYYLTAEAGLMPQSSLNSLPEYLRRYCTTQNYEKYSSQDHAAWRYIMRQSREYFRGNAVTIYLDGLRKTGIPLDRIPKISEMDLALQEFGWGAVPVCGFIPPMAFLDLQARGILPIATDMRTVNHIGYTPSPDIVHEAAGHAPIIADLGYREYLRKYARLADKTIMSSEDLNVYEAIRVLSDAKENPDTAPGVIDAVRKDLDKALSKVSFVSEASKVSRMAWWTVEYGLIGKVENPKIYGAGLLSSISESQRCLNPKVIKIPLSVNCVETAFDITEPQPQLFVAEDMEHLTRVLHDLEDLLAFKKGGVYGLEEARRAKTVNSIQLDSGVQISGVLEAFEASSKDGGDGSSKIREPHFIKLSGPTQLCIEGRELPNQGRVRHAQGFSSPIGRWVAASHTSPTHLSDGELSRLGIKKGQRVTLDFVNGFKVNGVVQNIVREGHKIMYITWNDCSVHRGSQKYYDPSWGEFDMVVGEAVTSVFGGPADRGAYGHYEMGGVSTEPGRKSEHSPAEKKIFSCYSKIRDIRQKIGSAGDSDLVAVADDALANCGDEWLLALEVLELSLQNKKDLNIGKRSLECLNGQKNRADSDARELIEKGIKLAEISD